ncbi:MAG: M15 family metallopeptidase [Eubacteriales bacterium]|nr:M15 family metallopeptidase [Eubacteriales bacterium]
MIRKKIKPGDILKIVLAVLVVCIAAAAALLCFRLNNSRMELKEENRQYSQENIQKQSEIDSLKAQLQEKETQLQENAGQPQEQSEGAAEGALSPSRGDSLFSDKRGLQPGEILDPEAVKADLDSYFTQSSIERDGEIFQRINGKSYRDNDDISLDELSYLKLVHYNFNNEIQVGEMIVNAALAEDVLSIFKELFQLEYQIQSIYLIDNYWEEGMTGDEADNASIEENNTSCFCYRAITGGGSLSDHAYGRAIDINPQQNPYINADGSHAHSNADPYVDRNSGAPHMIADGDECYKIFAHYGFSWGGLWSAPTDYQHFYRKAD